MLLLRRCLVLIALSFWQGGFTFYASAVVPLGQEVFGSLRQGFLTQQVTVFLNLAGAVALLVLLWDQIAARDPSRRRRWIRWGLWAVMLLGLLRLFQLHARLDELLIVKGRIIRDADLFHVQHRIYLWISTVQWVCGLLYLPATILIWRSEDGQGKEREKQ